MYIEALFNLSTPLPLCPSRDLKSILCPPLVKEKKKAVKTKERAFRALKMGLSGVLGVNINFLFVSFEGDWESLLTEQ